MPLSKNKRKFEMEEMFEMVSYNSEIRNELRDCMMLEVLGVHLKSVVISLR